MGRIEGRKKKGRPSSADLPRRNSSTEREPRRSCRRRNVRYNFDIDDYVDDRDFYADVGRREKKLRVLLGEDDSESNRCEESSSSDDYDEVKPSKKRKIDGGDSDFDGEDDEDNEIGEIRGGKVEAEEEDAETGGANSVPGTPSDPPKGIFLPDKKTLDLILDKLQKKDIYGVYAEPVDPDELPDYHDVIKHPMDFATVRKKLAKGTYLTLEQFESDVLLICTNAMQYNAPDTIYYKQASSIQELAKRKFQRLRLNVDHSGIELKPGHKIKPGSSPPKKQSKKSVVRTVQEPVGSDLSGATLATTGEFQNGSSAQDTSVRPGSFDGLVAENYSLMDNKLDKGDDFIQGKGFASRLGRKPPVHDENRRATFNISIQPVNESESTFSTFEGESKQFIPVGLHSDHSYTSSLARFAATLGSVAWKIASRRIEQALPEGIKFGRGWVGEYEPLPTPVPMIGNCALKESDFLTRYLSITDVRTNDKASRNTAPGDDKASRNQVPGNEKASTNPAHQKEHYDTGYILQKLPVFGNASGASTRIPSKQESPREASAEMGPPSVSVLRAKSCEIASSKRLQQNSKSRNLMEPEKKDLPQVERTYPSPTHKSTADVASRQISNASDTQSPRPAVVSRQKNLLPLASFKHPNGNKDGSISRGLSNSKPTLVDSDCNTIVTTGSNVGPINKSFPQQQEQQGLSDPVQMMRKLAEKVQHQQVYSNTSSFGLKREDLNNVASTAPEFALNSQHQQINSNGSLVCPKRKNSSNVSSTATHEWMSLGGVTRPHLAENRNSHKNTHVDSYHHQPQVSPYRSEFSVPRTDFLPDKNGGFPQPIHAFLPQPVRVPNEAQFQNRQVVFPQLVTADLSRFQVQSHWRAVTPHMQQQPPPPRLKQQESRPPDLNIGYQSVRSPVSQSSGMLVDSQHPDLALQL